MGNPSEWKRHEKWHNLTSHQCGEFGQWKEGLERDKEKVKLLQYEEIAAEIM